MPDYDIETALEDFGEDHDSSNVIQAVLDVAEAQGGIDKLSQQSGIPVETIAMISTEGKSVSLEIVEQLLRGVGMRMSVESVQIN